MHIDSAFWKTELNPVADRLEEMLRYDHFSQRRANILEQHVMVALFSVRVLIERHKHSEEFLRAELTVEAYPKKVAKPVTWLNSHKIKELYDLSSPVSKRVNPLFLCNQVIHSYILLPVSDNKCFSHILVCSDYERNRFLYFVPLPDVVALIRSAASDFPSRMEMNFNAKRQDYDIRQYRSAEQDAAPNSRPPAQLRASPRVQTPDSQRTSSSGGCG